MESYPGIQSDSETIIKKLFTRIPKECRLAFLSTFVIGLLVHLYMFTNKLPNHDDLPGLFARYDQAWAGRWLIKYLMPVNTSISLPWVNGVFSVLMLAIMTALIVSMFFIKRPLLVMLLSGIVACSPILATLFAYMFLADVNMFAAVLAVLGVYLANKKRFGFLFSAALFACSMAVYQTLIFVSVSLMALQLILCLLDRNESDKSAFRMLWRYAASLIIGAVLYVAVTKIFLLVGKVALTYMNTSEILDPNFSDIPHRLFQCYYYFVKYADWYNPFFNTRWMQYLFMLLIFSFYLLIALLVLLGKGKSIWRILAACLIALAMPVFLNGAYLAAGFAHPLMYFSMIVFFIGLVILFDRFSSLITPESKKAYRFLYVLGSWFVVVSMIVCCYSWSLYNNQAYFALQRKYEASYSLATRVVDRIEQIPEYTAETPVLIAGSFFNGNYVAAAPESYDGMAYSVGTEENTEYSYMSGSYGWFQQFLKNYLGANYAQVSAEKLAQLVADYNDFADMPCFPAAGSVQYLDGVIVVKGGN